MPMVRNLVGGVDTHADFDVAAAVDHNGGVLDVESFPADGTRWCQQASLSFAIQCLHELSYTSM